jgi:hypothetical protein
MIRDSITDSIQTPEPYLVYVENGGRYISRYYLVFDPDAYRDSAVQPVYRLTLSRHGHTTPTPYGDAREFIMKNEDNSDEFSRVYLIYAPQLEHPIDARPRRTRLFRTVLISGAIQLLLVTIGFTVTIIRHPNPNSGVRAVYIILALCCLLSTGFMLWFSSRVTASDAHEEWAWTLSCIISTVLSVYSLIAYLSS